MRNISRRILSHVCSVLLKKGSKGSKKPNLTKDQIVKREKVQKRANYAMNTPANKNI